MSDFFKGLFGSSSASKDTPPKKPHHKRSNSGLPTGADFNSAAPPAPPMLSDNDQQYGQQPVQQPQPGQGHYGGFGGAGGNGMKKYSPPPGPVYSSNASEAGYEDNTSGRSSSDASAVSGGYGRQQANFGYQRQQPGVQYPGHQQSGMQYPGQQQPGMQYGGHQQYGQQSYQPPLPRNNPRELTSANLRYLQDLGSIFISFYRRQLQVIVKSTQNEPFRDGLSPAAKKDCVNVLNMLDQNGIREDGDVNLDIGQLCKLLPLTTEVFLDMLLRFDIPVGVPEGTYYKVMKPQFAQIDRRYLLAHKLLDAIKPLEAHVKGLPHGGDPRVPPDVAETANRKITEIRNFITENRSQLTPLYNQIVAALGNDFGGPRMVL